MEGGGTEYSGPDITSGPHILHQSRAVILQITASHLDSVDHRFPCLGALLSQVLEIKGSSALFEASASGGLFVGCYFLDDPDPQEVRSQAHICA